MYFAFAYHQDDIQTEVIDRQFPSTGAAIDAAKAWLKATGDPNQEIFIYEGFSKAGAYLLRPEKMVGRAAWNMSASGVIFFRPPSAA
jgi:hypothetical protein